jgi:LacI family transcriptional regulator
MKKTSVKEIARLANVSIGTVDRVLHNRGRVAKETEKKIKKIIRELDYKPNVYARNLKLAKNYKFSVLMPEVRQDSSYWTLPYEGMIKASNELSTLKVNVQYYNFNRYQEESFYTQCKKAIEDNPDGLIIAPVLYEAAKNFIGCIPESLPYVFFDSLVPGANPLSIIAQDPFRSGRLAASLMCLLLPAGGEVVIIRNLPRDYHIDQRVKGFLDYFRDRENFFLLVFDIQYHENDNLFDNIIEQIKNQHPDIKGLFVTHANTYPFVHALTEPGKAKKLAVIGFDLIRENVDLLKTGQIDFLISQKPKVQGYQSIYALYRHLILKEPVSPKILMPLEIISKENIEESSLL